MAVDHASRHVLQNAGCVLVATQVQEFDAPIPGWEQGEAELLTDPVERALGFARYFERWAENLMGADSACLYIAALSERDLLLWPVHDAVLRAVTTGRREVAALLAPAIAARSEHIGDAPDPHELAGSDASPASGVPAPDRDPTRRSLTGSLPPAQLPAFDRKRICGRVGLPLGERFSAGAGCAWALCRSAAICTNRSISCAPDQSPTSNRRMSSGSPLHPLSGTLSWSSC
jgi:hypothetical protein